MIEYIQKQNLKNSISALFRKCQNKTKNSNFEPKRRATEQIKIQFWPYFGCLKRKQKFNFWR